MLVRISGLVVIVLGLLFWTGHALTLIPLHILFGILLVVGLLALALLAARAAINPAIVATAVAWAVMVLIFGLTQTRLLTGDIHWVIQVLHLTVGLSAIGQGEALAARIREARPRPARV